MGFWSFLVLLGVIHLLLWLVWDWLICKPIQLLVRNFNLTKLVPIIQIIGAYLVVSMTSIATLVYIEDVNGTWGKLIYVLAGAFIIYLDLAGNNYERHEEAAVITANPELRHKIDKRKRQDLAIALGAILFYVIILAYPSIAKNTLNIFLFSRIVWAYNLPYVGWLLKVIGIVYMVAFSWMSISWLLSVAWATAFVFSERSK